MSLLNQKKKNPLPSLHPKKRHNTVWDMMRRRANDNTPPILYWFYKILIVSLVVFGLLQLANTLVKF